MLRFLSRFDRLAKSLRNRSRGKPAFEIADEYDVQDLVYAALKPSIDDLTRENPYPKVAGTSGRVDIVSPGLNLVVEIKTTVKEGREKEIVRECMERTKLYSAVPGIEVLAFFIYDPDGRIEDIDNVRAGLEGPHPRHDRSGNFEVVVVGSGLPASRGPARGAKPRGRLEVGAVRPYTASLGVLIEAKISLDAGVKADAVALRLGKNEYRPVEPPSALIDSIASDCFPPSGLVGPTSHEVILYFGLDKNGLGLPARYGSSGLLELRNGTNTITLEPLDLPEAQAVAILDTDAKIKLASWFDCLTDGERRRAITFVDVDVRLGLPPGTAKRLLADAVSEDYEVKSAGDTIVAFRAKPLVVRDVGNDRWGGY